MKPYLKSRLLKYSLLAAGAAAMVAVFAIGVAVTHSQTSFPTIGIQVADDGLPQTTHPCTEASSEVTAPASGGWSSWAVVPTGEIHCVRMELRTSDPQAPLDTDFRIGLQMAADDGSGGCVGPGPEFWTNWASENSNLNAAETGAVIAGSGNAACVRIKAQTRPVPSGLILSNTQLGVYVWSSAGTGSAITPPLFNSNGSPTGGISSWAGIGLHHVVVHLAASLSSTLNTVINGQINVGVISHATTAALNATWTIRNSSGATVVNQSSPASQGAYTNMSASAYTISAAPSITDASGTRYNLASVIPGDTQTLASGVGCVSGQTNPHREQDSSGNGCTYVQSCGVDGCGHGGGGGHEGPLPTLNDHMPNWLSKTLGFLHLMPTTAEAQGGSSTPNITFLLEYEPVPSNPPSLNVNLTASPSSGPNPLNTTLTATVGGNAAGTINYYFWWNCSSSASSVSAAKAACGDPATNSSVGTVFMATTGNPKQAPHTYTANATAKVIVERGALSAEDSASISVGGDTITGQHWINRTDSGLCRALGWAYNSAPNASPTVQVNVYSDGIKVDTETANRNPGWVPNGSCAPGNTGNLCGFIADLTGRISPYATHSIEVRGVLPNGHEVALSNTPLPITCSNTTGSELSCFPTQPTTTVGQVATFNAFNGNGSYSWTALDSDASPASGSGNQFGPRYSSAGTKTVKVVSGTASTTCTVSVTGGGGNCGPNGCGPGGGSGQFSCSALPSTVLVGQSTTLTAVSGTAPFAWSGGGSPASGNGTSFSTSFSTPGYKTLSVTDGANPAHNTTCGVTVTNGLGTINVIAKDITNNVPIATKWKIDGPSAIPQTAAAASSATYPNEGQGSYTITVQDADIPAGYTLAYVPSASQFLFAGDSITFELDFATSNQPPTYPRLWVEPPTKNVTEGQSAYFTAKYQPTQADPAQDVTAGSVWSSNSGVATYFGNVYAAEFRGTAVGSAQITARYNGMAGTAIMNVTQDNNPPEPQNSYICDVFPPFRSSTRNASVNYTVTPRRNGIPAFKWVDLSVSDLPAGTTGSFSQNRVYVDTPSTLTLNVGNTVNGVYTFNVNCHLEEDGWTGQDQSSATGLNIFGDGGPTHLACVSNSCAVVPGAGTDSCSPQGSTCGVPTGPGNGVCTFTATPDLIRKGGSSTLTWSCGAGLHACTLKNGLTGEIVKSNGPSGSVSVSPATSTPYILDCDGSTFTATTTVRVLSIQECNPGDPNCNPR